MRRAALLLALVLWPVAVSAQLATLVADSVSVEGNSAIVAEGNVEVFFDDRRLRASRLRYDRTADRLTIDGPITIVDGEDYVLVAEQAALDPAFENVVLRSARLVLNQQLQLAAAEINRVGGRYTQLSRTVASSCEVCAANPVPIWEIRARRVIHDQQERQLYFDGAQIRAFGVPIFYLPRLRLPDPSVERARGVLLPRVRTSSQLGTGLEVPYFIPLGESADVTLTPYLSTRTRTLQARYRQAFRHGEIAFSGAYSRDDIPPGDERYYLFGAGRFALPRQFVLRFDIEAVSDRAYLLDYGFSDRDRLDSEVAIERARRKDYLRAGITRFETLRENEIPIADFLPESFGRLQYERRIPTPALGGEARLHFDAATLRRDSTIDGRGRDLARVGGGLDWRGDRLLGNGMVMAGTLGMSVDAYQVSQDTSFSAEAIRTIPRAAVTLRWPLQKTGPGGVAHLLEPVAQIVWSRIGGDEVPNEDSVLVEFDEGNLFALSRFPGRDRFEEGLRANLGVGYTRQDPAGGWRLDATLGRILRFESEDQFDPGSGLSGESSNWLAAAQLRFGDRLSLTDRALFDNSLDFSKNELRLTYLGDDARLGASYLFLEGEPAEARPTDTHELTLDAGYRFGRHWTGLVDTRYDFTNDSAARAGVGLQYRNECITVDLSLSRRFTSSSNVQPTTDLGVEVALAGFGAGDGRARSYRRRCGR